MVEVTFRCADVRRGAEPRSTRGWSWKRAGVHARSRAAAGVLLVDREFVPVMRKGTGVVSDRTAADRRRRPEFAVATDHQSRLRRAFTLLRRCRFTWRPPADNSMRFVSTTSGTTGNPSVVYHHRGAYLNAVGSNAIEWICRNTQSTSGLCRCSTATAGCFPWTPPALVSASACAKSIRR